MTVLNRKGGCSKTSTCFHASAAFASRGLRVLLVDTDPQANLTQGLLGPDVVRKMDPSKLPLETDADNAALEGNGPDEPEAGSPKAEASAGADSADVMKIPEPIIAPMTSMVASRTPRSRTRAGVRLDLEVDSGPSVVMARFAQPSRFT